MSEGSVTQLTNLAMVCGRCTHVRWAGAGVQRPRLAGSGARGLITTQLAPAWLTWESTSPNTRTDLSR